MGLIDQFRAKQRELDERARQLTGDEDVPERTQEAASGPRKTSEEGLDA
ncbi:hypothetical protein [Streptomyces violens]|nr:hypothetical protein [Streptomyces violens]